MADVETKSSSTSSARKRKAETPSKSAPKAKRATRGSAAVAEEKMDEKEAEEEKEDEEREDEKSEEDGLFANYVFMLTSSARRTGGKRAMIFLQPAAFCVAAAQQFNKRECKLSIEERGGTIAEEEEILSLPSSTKTFLVADTYYRTHKYLLALAASIPCVHFNWVEACVSQVRASNFRLQSKRQQFRKKSSIMSNTCCRRVRLLSTIANILGAFFIVVRLLIAAFAFRRPLKGELLKNKTLFVHSMNPTQTENVIPFVGMQYK